MIHALATHSGAAIVFTLIVLISVWSAAPSKEQIAKKRKRDLATFRRKYPHVAKKAKR